MRNHPGLEEKVKDAAMRKSKKNEGTHAEDDVATGERGGQANGTPVLKEAMEELRHTPRSRMVVGRYVGKPQALPVDLTVKRLQSSINKLIGRTTSLKW